MNLRTQVLSGLKWAAAARLLGQLVTWAITIVVMRLLTPSDYGLLSLATIFVAFFGLVAEIGLSAGIVQSEKMEVRQLREVFGAVIVMNLVLCFVTFIVVAPLAANYFDEQRLKPVMQLLALQFLPNAFTVLPTALLERDLKFRGRSIIDLTSSVAGSLLTLMLAYRGMGVWALVWGTLVQVVWRAIGLNLLQPFKHMPVFWLVEGGKLFRYGRDIVLTRLLWFFYSQADVFIAGKVLGTSSLGLYSVSMHLASLPIQRVSAIVNQVAFAAFARANREAGSVDLHTLLSVRALSFFAFPALWGMSSVAPELIVVLLGNLWQPAIPAFQLLCLVMPIRMLSPVVHAALQGVGRVDVSLRNTLFAAVVMPVAFYVGSKFDLLGLALSWVVVFPLVFLGNLVRSLSYLKLHLMQILRAMGLPAVLSFAMYAAVYLVRPELNGSPSMKLLVLILVGAASYGLLSLVFNRDGLREIWMMIARRKA